MNSVPRDSAYCASTAAEQVEKAETTTPSRNKANAGEQGRPIEDVIFRARSVIRREEPTAKQQAGAGGGIQAQRWRPPPPDIWKINVDAAFWKEELMGAWGFVVRDNLAIAALAGAGHLSTVSDALCAEAHACVEALLAAATQGMQHIILETDSATLVKALQSSEHDLAPGGVLFREAKFILDTMFSSWSVVFVNLSCNSVAHDLARFGRDRDPDHPFLWMHPLPDFVNDLLVRDITAL